MVRITRSKTGSRLLSSCGQRRIRKTPARGVNRGRSNIEDPPRSTQLQKIPIEWSIHLMSGRAIEPNKVLIVEDNEQDRCLLESIVTSLGYPVETAMNGREALAKLETM